MENRLWSLTDLLGPLFSSVVDADRRVDERTGGADVRPGKTLHFMWTKTRRQIQQRHRPKERRRRSINSVIMVLSHTVHFCRQSPGTASMFNVFSVTSESRKQTK